LSTNFIDNPLLCSGLAIVQEQANRQRLCHSSIGPPRDLDYAFTMNFLPFVRPNQSYWTPKSFEEQLSHHMRECGP